MRRLLPYIACLAGIVALVLVIPYFSTAQPRDVRVSRGDALAISDAEARRIGIPVDKAWSSQQWQGSELLDTELEKTPARRRAAAYDPTIGPRLGAYHITYFRRGLEKFSPYGELYVSGQTGAIVGERLRLRNEEQGAQATVDQLRAKSDAFVASRTFPGSPKPHFESARPSVQRNRTDWVFRYRASSSFPTGDVVPYLYIYFNGDRLAGFYPIEEYADGSTYRGDYGIDVAGLFGQMSAIFVLLLVLLIIFLKKYHAGEVGVGTSSFLFGLTLVIAVAYAALTSVSNAEGSNLGTLPAQQTAFAVAGFQILFYQLPLCVLVFLAWAVGESYARERWGQRLASFDAILRRDPVNATVGRSLLDGLLAAPAAAACALLAAAIPLALGLAHPMLGSPSSRLLSSGPIAELLGSAQASIVYPIVAVLFVLSFSRSRRALGIGIVASVLIAMIGTASELPIGPLMPQCLFAFGGIAAVIVVFLAQDLLAAAVAFFFGSLIVSFLPLLSVSHGDFLRDLLLVCMLPLLVTLIFAVAALLTGREVVYTYEDLAPHVKRIVERERVKAEIDAANRIQAALLPLDAPDMAGASVASHYRAATEIGGDYFDFLPLPDGQIGIAFGDVSGHGLTSGIVMAMAKSALLVQVGYDASPRAVLDVLNDIVMRTAPKRTMMTFFFGLLDPQTQKLRFSSAGHLDPYVHRAATGRIEPLSSWGFPLGVKRRDPFRELTVAFDAGDRLVLYSDGLIEALDDDGEPFGFERFEHVLAETADLDAEETKKAILTAVRKFTHNRPPEDDQTLVVVSFHELERAAAPPPILATVGISTAVN